MARFTDEDDRGFLLLPVGKYPGQVVDIIHADNPDSEGRSFYKAKLELVSGDFKGTRINWAVSEHWMKHLLIHFMRSTGMMTDMIVDPFFRADPQDSASFDLKKIVGNMSDCMVVIEVSHSVNKNDGKTYHGVKDFHPPKKRDGSPVDQPKWIDTPSSQVTPDNVVLDADTDLEEDEDFFVD